MRVLLALVALSSASWSTVAFAPARSMVPVTRPAATSMTMQSSYMPIAKASSKLHMSSAAASMEDPNEGKEATSGGDGAMPALMFNLVKSILGAGVLSLPAGMFLLSSLFLFHKVAHKML